MGYDEKKGEVQLTYEEIHKLSEHICKDIKTSGWQPDVIVAIACGGWLPARLFKLYLGVDAYSLGVSHYGPNNKRKEEARITQRLEGIDSILKGKRILVVDEVDDKRGTLLRSIAEIKERHKPLEIRIAVLYQKEKEKVGEFPEDIFVYVGQTMPDKWIDFPWEAKDIDLQYRLANETKL